MTTKPIACEQLLNLLQDALDRGECETAKSIVSLLPCSGQQMPPVKVAPISQVPRQIELKVSDKKIQWLKMEREIQVFISAYRKIAKVGICINYSDVLSMFEKDLKERNLQFIKLGEGVRQNPVQRFVSTMFFSLRFHGIVSKHTVNGDLLPRGRYYVLKMIDSDFNPSTVPAEAQ